ncbi:MAG: CDP-glycerol glycerophosphotransferase family protein [Nitrososphaera sp.]
MSRCEVIVNFNFSDFDAVRQSIDIKNPVFFVDNLVAYYKIRGMGLRAEHIRQYFGYVNPTLYAIYDRAIEETRRVEKEVADVKYCGISIVDGLHSYIMDRLTFMEKIKYILDQKNDVIFLFSYPDYFYYAIVSLAEELGYEVKYGVSSFTGGKVAPISFEEAYRVNYKYLYDDKEGKKFDPDSDVFVPSLSIDAGASNPRCGFFLVNNDEDFYLRPVYPVLAKFDQRNVEKVVFTFSARTTNQLKKRSMQAYELSVHIDPLESEMLRENRKLIAHFFYRLRNIRGAAASTAYFKHFGNDRIGREIARLLGIIAVEDAIFRRYSFESVLVGADGVSETEYVCSLARKHGVPSFSIPPAMTESAPIYGFLYSAEKLLLSGPRLKKELVSLGVPENRLVVTGNPRFDYIKNGNASPPLPEDKQKLVLVAMSRMHENDEVWMSELVRYCNQKGLDIVIKLHPLYKFIPDLNEICEQKIKMINESCQGMEYQISYDADASALLPLTRVLITEYSLLGVEAAIHEKPVIVANMAGETFYDYSFQFQREGIALYSRNTPELFDCMEKILHDPSTSAWLAGGRRVFNPEFNYLNDGKAAERVFAILTSRG